MKINRAICRCWLAPRIGSSRTTTQTAHLISRRKQSSSNEDDVLAIAQEFIKGNDAMRTFRQVYVAGKLVKNGIALMSVVELMDQAMSGVDAALAAPAATVAVQPEELSDMRARALS